MKQLWGIDLGGTKIEGIVLEASTLRTVIRKRIPTGAENGYRHILSQVGHLVEIMSEETGTYPACIGIGTPGSLEPRSGRLKNSNTVCLNGKMLLQDLGEVLGMNVKLENDANCFALAELLLGAAAGRNGGREGMMFGIILGTGVGGGIVCNGRVVHGAHGIAGEWGHNELLPGGPPCYCGRSGCVETVLSGPALEAWYAELSGTVRSLREIASLADSDWAASRTIDRLVEYFGKAVAGVINILDPDIIVIGGGVGNIDALYTDRARAAMERHLFTGSLEIPVVRPQLGDSAGVFGAALLTEKT
jgi:fructokinase